MLFGIDTITGKGVQAFYATSRALHVWIAGGISGMLDQFDRLAGGAVVQGLAANQSADGVAVTGACLLYAIRCTASASGVVTIYDGVTAAGKQIATSMALTANTTYNLAGGAGEQMSTGVYVDLVSGTATFDILYVPGV